MNIAVIAVHGVGDQKPLESAHAISDLLQDLDVGESCDVERPSPCAEPKAVQPRYEPFTARPLRINVRPVVVGADRPRVARSELHGPFHSWVNQLFSAPRDHPSSAPAANDVATIFMRGQLQCYGGDTSEETYETERLEGTRTDDGHGARTVHVYELYWADLSRLKAGILSIFTELYQLLFHLSSLGTHVVDAEATQHPTAEWRRFRRVQAGAASILTVPIPVLNLFMLGVTLVIAVLAWSFRYPLGWRTVVTLSVAGALPVAFVGWIDWHALRIRVALWLLPVAVWLIGVAAIAVERNAIPGQLTNGTAAVLLAGAVTFLLKLALDGYEERRPGVRRKAWLIGTVSLVIAAIAMWWRWDVEPYYSRTVFILLRLFEVMNALLMVSWIVFVTVAIGSFFTGIIAVNAVQDRAQAALARSSRCTARLMLTLPAIGFLVVTLIGWGLLSYVMRGLVGAMRYEPAIWRLPGVATVGDLITAFLNNQVFVALPLLLSACAIAALPAIWGMTPVALAEVKPPSLYEARTGEYSERLGHWLTLAFQGLRTSRWILYDVMTFALPFASAVALSGYVAPLNAKVRAAIQAVGAASGLLFAWLFSIRGTLRKAALGFRPALDILLDVDNWLREHPLSRNPRARICGRYVSLLRYICGWEDVEKKGYDAIVIVAHSQGTVITADLLRFLALEPDPQLSALGTSKQVCLFTMGCPLRQLYGARFPRLYGWATHDDQTRMDRWTQNDLVTPPRPAAEPNPADLRVRRWLNAYRSGDYIGRYLWRTDACAYAWDPDILGGAPSNSTDGATRVEFCVGAGAHTHYWDETARPIAWALDRLVAEAPRKT